MKVPLSWIKEFVPIRHSLEQIVTCLTNLGIEVDDVTGADVTFSGIVVGEVVSAERHPNADRLQITTVSDGTRHYNVVCGAPNCRKGIRVPFAPPGAQLLDTEGNPWILRKSTIRGCESEGMLCSSRELRLGDEHNGILELGADAPLGLDITPLVLDPILTLSLTPNLGHCQSILGIARELAAGLSLPLHHTICKTIPTQPSSPLIKTLAPQECPYFSCRVIENIPITPSPPWMKHRLKQCGITPINTLVDIGNYVMLETGQPLHIFDKHQIDSNQLIITTSTEPVELTTLDGKVRSIRPGILCVQDGSGPVSIAGILGGARTAVSPTTSAIVIESALFTPSAIRRACRLLDIKTEASLRFDRGVDPQGVTSALERASSLILSIAGGSAGPIVEVGALPPPTTIPLRPHRARSLIGHDLTLSEMTALLERLDMHIAPQTSEAILHVTVPSYRRDLHIEEDLIEELARLYGYQHLIQHTSPTYATGNLHDNPSFILERTARHLLLQEGLQECVTCDLISPQEQSLIPGITSDQILSVLHPRSLDQSVLRSSLLPSMLKVAQHNARQQQFDLGLFEIGRVHWKEGDQVFEPTSMGIFLQGTQRPLHFDRKPHPFDFLDLKGMLENICAGLRLPTPSFAVAYNPTLHPGRQAQIIIKERTLGLFGELHPQLVAQSHLRGTPLFAELNLSLLVEVGASPIQFHPFPPYPCSTRDWTLPLPRTVPFAHLEQLIKTHAPPHLASCTMIDSFTAQPNDPIPNITLRFLYRHTHQTLETATLDNEHQLLIETVAKKLAHLI